MFNFINNMLFIRVIGLVIKFFISLWDMVLVIMGLWWVIFCVMFIIIVLVF